MRLLPLVLAAIVLLLGSAFFSGTEMGLYCLNRLRLRLRAGRGDARAQVLLQLANRRQETVLAILLGNNLVNYLLTVAGSTLMVYAAHVGPDRADLYAAAILSPLVFVLGDVVPKNWFQAQCNRLMYRCAWLLRWTVLAARYSGALLLLQSMTRLGTRLAGHDDRREWEGARGEVIGLLREGAAEGGLSEEQTRMFERVMNLSAVRVGEIMIPRRRVVTIPVDADRRLFEEIVRSHEYSRMPVLSVNRRSVVGLVNVLDVLADEAGGQMERWLHPPLVIEARATAADALVKLRQAEEPMGIVTDPRRGFVGIITLKDVIEEIFGELPAW